jgi:hypothetical protein
MLKNVATLVPVNNCNINRPPRLNKIPARARGTFFRIEKDAILRPPN